KARLPRKLRLADRLVLQIVRCRTGLGQCDRGGRGPELVHLAEASVEVLHLLGETHVTSPYFRPFNVWARRACLPTLPPRLAAAATLPAGIFWPSGTPRLR